MPGSIRLFVDAPLAEGAEIAATPGQAHYLLTVMRRNAGDPVDLFNGSDGEWRARLGSVGRGGATLRVEARLRAQHADTDLWLAFAVLKRDATDLVVEKATELGIAALLPVFTVRTNAGRVNEARLLAIATEAAEQCERLSVPILHPPQRLAELLARWPAERALFVAMERCDAPPLPAVAGPAGLLVGPEGGWTPAECDALRGHPFVRPVSLGSRILRAETASIVGLALLQACR